MGIGFVVEHVGSGDVGSVVEYGAPDGHQSAEDAKVGKLRHGRRSVQVDIAAVDQLLP